MNHYISSRLQLCLVYRVLVGQRGDGQSKLFSISGLNVYKILGFIKKMSTKYIPNVSYVNSNYVDLLPVRQIYFNIVFDFTVL